MEQNKENAESVSDDSPRSPIFKWLVAGIIFVVIILVAVSGYILYEGLSLSKSLSGESGNLQNSPNSLNGQNSQAELGEESGEGANGTGEERSGEQVVTECLIREAFDYKCTLALQELSIGEFCSSVDSSIKNLCYYHGALVKQDNSFCSYITDSILKEDCSIQF